METKDYDPWDFYEEYSEWLMTHADVFNGDDLINKFEEGYLFEDFLEHHAASVPD